jgi:hypothetical protein
MLTACKMRGNSCDPSRGVRGGCCAGLECDLGGKKRDQHPYRCRTASLSTKAKVLGEGTVGKGAAAAGGDIKVTVHRPRYLITWYDKQGNGAISDLSESEADDLITAVVAMGGGEADIPRCTKFPTYKFALYPMDSTSYPPGMFSDLLNAINHKNEGWLAEHAFKYATVKTQSSVKSLMFHDLWPGNYWLYNLTGLKKGSSTVKIGVENFDQGLGNVLGNMYSMLKSYLGGDMDWKQITVLRSCKPYPSYLRVNPGSGRMSSVASYTYQPYQHYSFREGNVSGTFEWLEEAFNDMGEYFSDTVQQEFGEDFGW